MSSTRENAILIDWLSLTSKLHSPEEIISLLGMEECKWQSMNGMHGYQERLWYDSISIHYAGRSDMGVWLEMSGQGCRAFETYGHGDYNVLFDLILNEPLINITRLDVAFDEYDNILDICRICSDTVKHNYRSKMDYYQTTQSSNGQSVDIGSHQSDVMIRIYDKLAERLSKLRSESDKEKIRDDIPHWIRVELQMRDERAKEFVRHLSGRDIGSAFTGVLRNYLEYGYFRESEDGKRTFSTYAYWDKVLSGAEKLSIYVKPAVDYNLARLENYVFNVAGNAVDALFKIHGSDLFMKKLAEREISQNPKYLTLIDKHTKEKCTTTKDITLPNKNMTE